MNGILSWKSKVDTHTYVKIERFSPETSLPSPYPPYFIMILLVTILVFWYE